MSLLQREARAADLLPEPPELPDDKKKGRWETKKEGKKAKGMRERKYEKRNELVRDYLIPVVRLMKVEGKTHTEAFQIVNNKLGLTTGTTSAQCVRGVRLFPEEEFHTQEFVEAVESGEIVQRAKQNRPRQIELIERELEPLYS